MSTDDEEREKLNKLNQQTFDAEAKKEIEKVGRSIGINFSGAFWPTTSGLGEPIGILHSKTGMK